MSADGTWNTTINTPMGAQQGTLTLVTDGASLTGKMAGAAGEMELNDGAVDGDTLTWSMDITSPMPMTLNNKATVDGDTMTGTVNAGAFGDMPLSGTRKV